MTHNICEHDAITHETIIRKMTDAELAQKKIDDELAAQKGSSASTGDKLRSSAVEKLKTLGLTEAEVAALLGA